MPEHDEYELRSELLDALMEKVEADRYPSNTMLDMIESLLTPPDLERYAELLLARVREDEFPSIPMLQRLRGLT